MTLGVTPTINIEVYRGSDVYVPIQVEQSLVDAIGVVDIGGWNFLMTIRDTDTVGSTYHQSVNGTITNAGARTVLFHITDTVNEALPVGDYKHDIWRTDADFEFPLAVGNYTVLPNRRVPS